MPPTSSTAGRSPDSGRPDPAQDAATASDRSVILKPVFIPSSIAIIGLIGLVIVFRDQAEDATVHVHKAITDGLGWWYVIAVNVFLFFALYFAFSRIGRIRLGRDDEQPEFGLISWFLMLFSAGMGIGLVFFGVAEPLSHYVTPPEAFGADPKSSEAAQDSVGLMMLQWGLHPWAIYAVVGLGLAYMSFRRGRPLAVRWLLEPLIGRRRVEGWTGHTIDAVAIVGTLFGIATSFGFGVRQIIAGLEYLGWAQESTLLIIAIIVAVTAIAVWSVVSGVHKGLKWLSNINMSIASVLAVVVFLLGPTLFLLKALPDNFGSYIAMLPDTMFHTGPFATDGWEAAWPIAYWGWWTSWAPFVGMFIARISRGRTIREFILGVLIAPTLASLAWFTVFGASAIFLERNGTMSVGDSVNSTTALFTFFDSFPVASLLSVVAILVVIFFFVTSSDSGSLVIDMLASGGRVDTPAVTRIYWACLEGVAAAVLLIVGGTAALTALQTLSILTAAPFSVILVLSCLSLLKAFRHEVATMPNYMQVIQQTEPVATQPLSSTRRHENGEPDEISPLLSITYRHALRGIRGISSTFGGLNSAPAGPAPRAEQPSIVSFRHISPSEMTFDPETGDPCLAEQIEDPLAGEVFDTPEFESSQEFINQGGAPDAGRADEDLQPT